VLVVLIECLQLTVGRGSMPTVGRVTNGNGAQTTDYSCVPVQKNYT